MSVVETIVLPAQPVSGQTIIVPLGGNGYTAPRSVTYSECELTGDASGGGLQMDWELEQNHSHMLHWVSIRIQSVGADQYPAVEMQIGQGINFRETVLCRVEDGANGRASAIFRPPPTFFSSRRGSAAIRPNVAVFHDNVNAQKVTAVLCAYQFQPEASQTTAWPYLVSNFSS